MYFLIPLIILLIFIGYNDSNPFTNSYVISIRPERYQAFYNRLYPWSKNITLYPGVVGKNLDLNNLINQGYLHSEFSLSVGQIGCALSHYNLWNKISRLKVPYSIICEDDANIKANTKTKQKINNAMKEVLKISPKPDLLYIGHNRRNSKINTKEIVTKHWSKAKKNCGNFCYAISPEGCNKLMTKIFPLKDRPIDNWIIDQMKLGTISVLCMNPRLCYVVPIISDTVK